MPEADSGAARPDAGEILRKTARGAGWVVGWRMSRRLLGLVSTIILTRLLLPADFGLVALATGLAGALEAVSNLGVEDALVRSPVVNRELLDTGFTLNLLRCALMAIVVAVAAVPAARFFNDPRLTPILLALAALTLVDGLENIGTVTFRRDIAFNKEFLLLTLPRLAGTVTAVSAALLTRSYWALVAGIAVTRVAGVVASYRMHPYRPALTLRAWRELAGFSAWVWALGFTRAIRDRLDQMMVGKLFGDRDVGVLTVSWELAHLPTSEIAGPLARASFSGFSAAYHAGADTGGIYLRVVASVWMFVLPAAVGVSAVAGLLVRVLLGQNWNGIGPIVGLAALLCVSAGYGPSATTLLAATGRMGIQFPITLAGTVLRLALLLAFVPSYHVEGAVWGTGIGMVLEWTAYHVVACRHLRLGVAVHAAVLWRPVAAAAMMTVVLRLCGLGWTAVPAPLVQVLGELVAASALGALVYATVILGLWHVSGRPGTSPEADVALLIKQEAQRFRARLRNWRPRGAA